MKLENPLQQCMTVPMDWEEDLRDSGIYPQYADAYAFHIFYDNPEAKNLL